MGTSFIDFKDYGFWARDAALEVWLYWLVQEIDQLDSLPEWLQEAQEDWYIQVTVGLVGSINPQLDDYLLSQERVNLVLLLCERVLKWLKEQGKYLSKEYLNSLGIGGPGSEWMAEVEVELFAQLGRKFVELLSGEVSTGASTSPVF